jgi:hypothetical protein
MIAQNSYSVCELQKTYAIEQKNILHGADQINFKVTNVEL